MFAILAMLALAALTVSALVLIIVWESDEGDSLL